MATLSLPDSKTTLSLPVLKKKRKRKRKRRRRKNTVPSRYRN